MTYDFDTPVDRSGTYSLKWEEAGDALPMWVADMEFQTAPQIRAALQQRLDHGIFGYSIVPPAWNQAYVDWWHRRHNLDIDPESLVFSTGVVPGNLQHGTKTHHSKRKRAYPNSGLQHFLQFDYQ